MLLDMLEDSQKIHRLCIAGRNCILGNKSNVECSVPLDKQIAEEEEEEIEMLLENYLHRGFFDKQKLTGPNFIDWYRQLRIMLSIEDKLNYLEQSIPPASVAPAGQQVAPEILAAHTAWVKGSKEIAGLMLMTMEPEIQRNLEPLHSHEMLKELKTLFAQQAEQELLETMRYFYSCRQEEGQSVSSYILKMKGYIDNLERLGHPVALGLGVSLILIGLRKEYDGFLQNYNMHSMGKTVNEFYAMLKLYEQTQPKSNAPALNAIRAGKVQKGNKHKKLHSQTGAKGHGKGKNKQAYAPKPKIPPPPKRENPAKDFICHERRTQLLELVVQGLRASRKLKTMALSLYVGNGQREVVEAIGAFYLCLPSGLEIVLNNCHYAPSITRGVTSVSRLYEDGFVNCFVNNAIQVLGITCNKRAKLDLDSALLWHCRLGHISKKHIEKLQHDGLLNSSNLRAFEKCVSCMSEKMDYALETAARILNMVPTKKVEKTPYEVWHGKAPNIPMLQSVKTYLGKCFAMKDLEKILKRYSMENSKRRSIPMQEKLKLSKSQGASTPAEMKRMQNVPYASAVGSIMYAVRCTRPDVAFAQNITSRFQQNPGDIHWTTVKNILKYLSNTKDMFLVYEGDLKRELRVFCYTDAGYLTDADDLKSQTGYVFILNGGAVDWKSAKQSIFATSSAEAEYIAAFDASKEVVWVRKFISGLGVVPKIKEPISMYCDNTGAIAIANESGITKGARYFHAKVHYLREVIEFGDIKLGKVHTDENLANPFTKALAFPKHFEYTKNIGMLPASSLMPSPLLIPATPPGTPADPTCPVLAAAVRSSAGISGLAISSFDVTAQAISIQLPSRHLSLLHLLPQVPLHGSKEIAGLMLMNMEPEIQRNLEPLHAHEMLMELKTLFAQQAEQELLQTTRDFYSCR
nr:zinc finger, CCHC-type [Tanacetum cinerariifolium]